MGKKKLLKDISGLLESLTDEELKSQFGKFFGYKGEKEFSLIAGNIYDSYHKNFPAIRTLQNKVSQRIRISNQIRNYFGRVYTINDKWYRAVNYLIQGTAADLLKVKLCDLLDAVGDKAKLKLTIHDSIIVSVKKEDINSVYKIAKEILEDTNFRIPIKIDCKVSGSNLGASINLTEKEAKDILNSNAYKDSIEYDREKLIIKLEGQDSQGTA